MANVFGVLPVFPLGFDTVKHFRIFDDRFQFGDDLGRFPLLVVFIVANYPGAVRLCQPFGGFALALPKHLGHFEIETILDMQNI